MTEFGKMLRSAREAKGMNLVQLAEITRMAPSRLEELEEENFSHIPAPIYGRGFIKLYCDAVGIDPKPLIDEYMAITNGERDSDIKERATNENKAAPAAPISEPKVEPAQQPEPPPPPPQKPIRTEPPVANFDLFSEAPKADNSFSKYAAPIRSTKMPSIPAKAWRLVVLAIMLLAVVLAIAVGVRALYRATSGAPAAVDSAATEAAKPMAAIPEKAKPAAAAKPANKGEPKAKRVPRKVQSLYID